MGHPVYTCTFNHFASGTYHSAATSKSSNNKTAHARPTPPIFQGNESMPVRRLALDLPEKNGTAQETQEQTEKVTTPDQRVHTV